MFTRVLMATAIVSLFAACSSTQPPAATTTPADTQAPVVQAPVGVDPAAAASAEQARLAAERARLGQQSVYFDFDSNAIRGDQQARVAAHAEFLKANPGQQIQIQGNTDARGSREYNLGLGQRRAQSVQQAMEVLGAKASQMEAVSFGKEKPRAEGNTEADYAENRRADVVYGQ